MPPFPRRTPTRALHVLLVSTAALACATEEEDDDLLEEIDDDADDELAPELELAGASDPRELPPYDPSCPGHPSGSGGGGGGGQICLTGDQCFFATPYGPDEIWGGTLRGFRGHHTSNFLCHYRVYLDQNGSYYEDYERCDDPFVTCAPECV
jgi:hypothetical protein